MRAPRAWKSRKLAHELTSSHSWQPGAHTSMSYFMAATNERSPVHIWTIRYWSPRRRQTSSASARSDINAPDRQWGSVEPLVAVEVRDRHLRGRDEPDILLGVAVEVLAELGQVPR